LKKELEKRVEELLREMARQYDFEIDAMEVEVDHVRMFLSAPPKYSSARIVEVLKPIGSNVEFEEFGRLKKELWVEEF
jgi:putative transposase